MRSRYALTALLTVACERAPHGRCALSPARTVALSAGHHFDASALIVRARGALAFYSDEGGLWQRPLASDGAPSAPARRLGARCAGGLAAAALPDARIMLACSRPAPDHTGTLAVLLLSPEPSGNADERVIAAIDEASRGVSISPHGAGAAVAFHDGGPDAHRVWLALVAADGAESPAPRALSARGVVAAEPSVIAHRGALYAAYVVSSFQLDAQRAELVVRDVQSERQVSAPLHHHDATPQLALFADTLVLTFRDRPSPSARVEQFAARLKPDLSFAAPPTRIGRASGLGGPGITLCEGTTYAAAPIEHGSELYVIFHGLDDAFAPLEANHQCYATEHSLVGAQAACMGPALLALVSEETDPNSAHAELLGMRFTCR